MFKFKYEDQGSCWPQDGKYHGYSKLEASEKAKEVIMSVKDKIFAPWLKKEPWLDEDVVMDIVRPGGEEAFVEMANNGDLKTSSDIAGYEWIITN